MENAGDVVIDPSPVAAVVDNERISRAVGEAFGAITTPLEEILRMCGIDPEMYAAASEGEREQLWTPVRRIALANYLREQAVACAECARRLHVGADAVVETICNDALASMSKAAEARRREDLTTLQVAAALAGTNSRHLN